MERMVIMVKVKILKNILFKLHIYNIEKQSKAKGGKGKVQKTTIKAEVYIPDDIDRAIGDNARHIFNECGRVVRTRAPLNIKNWKEAFTIFGDTMWKEIEVVLYEVTSLCCGYYAKTLQYPPPDLPQDQWQYCVERFGSTELKKISERNSKNQNQGVKPPADVIWLVEHTTRNNEGVLQWADESRSKEIHEQIKVIIATHGDSMTQEEILLDVLKPRSGYFRGKGTALHGYSKGSMQLEHQNLINEQQKQIQLQEQRLKEFQETQEKTTKQLQEAQERTSKQLEQQREDMQRSMEEMKQQLLSELIANRVLS
ncbi:Isocitrate dehydrogenase kinase/phosphatase [Bienertia sinuspersici]